MWLEKDNLCLFLDEYGTPTYKGLDKDPNKYFCLAAIIIEPDIYKNISKLMFDFKNKWFKHAEFPLHFREISKKKS